MLANAIAFPAAGRTVSAQRQDGQRIALDRHETVFLAGDEATQIFEVVEGAVMLSMLLEDGRRQIVDLVFPGGIVGLTAGGTYAATCETLTAATLRMHWRHDLARDEHLSLRLLERLERQICHLHDQSLSLGRKTAQEKVATLLVRFLSLAGKSEALAGRLELPMTRAEMGDYLGLSLETVCRTLTDLQSQRILEIGRRHGAVTVLNPGRLRCLARLADLR